MFFALWPSAPVRARLAALAGEAKSHCGGRAIAADNIHLTLFFVGSFERARLDCLEAIGGSLGGEAFELVFDRLGHWPHNRIVWAGTTRCPAPLASVAARLRGALAPLGLTQETRPYVPHVTLLRDARRPPETRRIESFAWAVRDLVLAESVQSARGVRYVVRHRWPLAAADGSDRHA